MKHWFSRASIAAMAIAVAGLFNHASAERVEIRTVDGGMAIAGELIEFDDQFLTIKSMVGTVRIRRELAICEGVGCPADDAADATGGGRGEVLITGSDSIGAELLPRLLQDFAATKAATVSIEIDPVAGQLVSKLRDSGGGDMAEFRLRLGSTDQAFQDLLTGRANMILTARRASEAEAQRFIAAGIGDIRDQSREIVVALDGLAMVVSPRNATPTVSLEQAAEIIAGRITDWGQVGGRPGPINLYLPPASDDALQVFDRDVMRPLRLRPSRDAVQAPNAAALASSVAADPAGFGLTTLAQSAGTRPMPLAQSCGLLAQPDSFSVKAEEYPLTRRIYLYTTSPSLQGFAGEFFTFAQSDQGQSGVRDIGFVDQGIISRTVNEQGLRFVSAIVSDQSEAELARLREMAANVQTAARLSATMRFNPGSSTLQPKSLADIERLVEMLMQPGNINRRISLLGFTDNVGRSDINQFLSAERAEGVRDAILAASQGRITADRIETVGYGPIAPIGCNDQPRGREANRRVEIWVSG